MQQSDCRCKDTHFWNEALGACSTCPPGFGFSSSQATCFGCNAGTYSNGGIASCVPCPAGRFSTADLTAGVDGCQKCGLGLWSNSTGADSEAACTSCDAGSTTEATGSEDASLCVKPKNGHLRHCISGRPCIVENIVGFGLRDGHRLAFSVSDCVSSKLAVPSMARLGISQPASKNGTRYVWGVGEPALKLLGGTYALCWCANIHDLTCADLQQNFLIAAGQLTVTGPFQHTFSCVRGLDCTVGPFEGHDLLVTDVVALRRDCPGNELLKVSEWNSQGLGRLKPTDGSSFMVTFGVSSVDGASHFVVDAEGQGYHLCWCASARGLDTACQEIWEFTVPAGRIKVLGPQTNQEKTCFVGQECDLGRIEGVEMEPGDRLMILADCGLGSAVEGFPNRGIAGTTDGVNFNFSNSESILLSPLGLFRMCFCRPQLESGDCENPLNFRAPLGFLSAQGPFFHRSICQLDRPCSIEISGLGVAAGDHILLASSSCGQEPGMDNFGFNLPMSFPLDDTGRLLLNLSTLSLDAVPGTYHLCWCPGSASCSSPELFRALAGDLQVDCPEGFFTTGRAGRQLQCRACPRGYHCPGGSPIFALRFPCGSGETTLNLSAASSQDCVCDAGFTPMQSQCLACEIGEFKPEPGSAPCLLCPENYATFASASTSVSSCIPINDGGVIESSNQSGSPRNESQVSTVSLTLSVEGIPSDASLQVRDHLPALLLQSLSEITRQDAALMSLEFGISGTRRLTEAMTVIVTVNQPTSLAASQLAADLDVGGLSDALTMAIGQTSTLASVQGLMLSFSNPSTSTAVVRCPSRQSVPPGTVALSPKDCQCSPGFGFNEASQSCDQCSFGQYKPMIGNRLCITCASLKSTLVLGATNAQECHCQESFYADSSGNCVECLDGFYCPGTGQAIQCPPDSDTGPGARSLTECTCNAGYFQQSFGTCAPCPPQLYKPNGGNEDCKLQCPANANSSLASTALDDCFCMADHHAQVDDDGYFYRCASCALYEGLSCEGGFKENRKEGGHREPVAKLGFFRTGNTLSVRCDAETEDGSSTCLGGSLCSVDGTSSTCYGTYQNACATGSAGMLCGECAEGWARPAAKDSCERCVTGPAAVALSISVDVLQRVLLNFVLAVIAAQAAVVRSSGLHTSVIRIGTQWLAACSVITNFKIEQLQVFSWSQEAMRSQQDVAAETSTTAWTYPWPAYITLSITSLFDFQFIPDMVSVQFATSCQAEELFPKSRTAKMIAPGLYYICLPLVSVMGTWILCACMVYIFIPVASKCGKYFNKHAQEKHEKSNAMKYLSNAIQEPLEELGLTWVDLEASGLLNEFPAAELRDAAFSPRDFMYTAFQSLDLWNNMLRLVQRCQDAEFHSHFSKLHLTQTQSSDLENFSLKVWICQGADSNLSDAEFDDFVCLRAVALKVASLHQDIVESYSKCSVLEVADALALACKNATELEQAALKDDFQEALKNVCALLVEDAALPEMATINQMDQTPKQEKQKVDVETLDFGLFTQLPSPRLLLKQSRPVVWLNLLFIWPLLLKMYLQMLWCVPIPEGDGWVVQRLAQHPDTQCWSGEHFPLAIIAVVGLIIWCVGLPLGLFLRICSSSDRQSQENFRKFGFFIEGFEPSFWWWDIIVKRFDIATMTLVAYTSLAPDDRAKLLLFPILSAFQLYLSALCRPFADDQAELLDFLDTFLLALRFFCFSSLAVVILLNPSAEATEAMSVTVLVVLVVGFSYFAVHAASQVLRKWSLSWEQEAVSGQFLPEAGFRLGGMHLHLSKTFKGVQGKWKSFVCKWVVPIFCEGDDERLIVQWSRAKVKVEFAMHKIPSGGYSPLVWLKHLRCFILRVGNFYQKSMVVKALEGFTDAWVFQFDQTCLPRVPIHQVLCALTAANLNVPNKIQKKGLKMVWMEEVKKVCQAMKASGPEGLQIPILEFGRTVRKFVMLSAADAFDMVEDVCSLLEENNTASAKQKEVLPLEPVANLQDDLEFRAVLPGCEEASGVGTKTKTSMNQVMPWSSEDSEEEVAPDLLVQIEQDKPQKVKQLEKQLAETERVKDLEAKLEEMEREQSKLRKLLRDYQKAEQLQIQEKLKQRLKEVAEKRRAIEALEEDCREALKMKENSDQMDVLEIMQDLADQRFKNDEAEEKLNKALEEVSVLPLDGGSELRKVSEVLEDMWGTMPSAKTWALASQEAVAQGAASSCQKSEVPQLLT